MKKLFKYVKWMLIAYLSLLLLSGAVALVMEGYKYVKYKQAVADVPYLQKRTDGASKTQLCWIYGQRWLEGMRNKYYDEHKSFLLCYDAWGGADIPKHKYAAWNLRLLSFKYKQGDGVKQNPDKALFLLKKSASLGDRISQHFLAEEYMHSRTTLAYIIANISLLNGREEVSNTIRTISERMTDKEIKTARRYVHYYRHKKRPIIGDPAWYK